VHSYSLCCNRRNLLNKVYTLKWTRAHVKSGSADVVSGLGIRVSIRVKIRDRVRINNSVQSC